MATHELQLIRFFLLIHAKRISPCFTLLQLMQSPSSFLKFELVLTQTSLCLLKRLSWFPTTARDFGIHLTILVMIYPHDTPTHVANLSSSNFNLNEGIQTLAFIDMAKRELTKITFRKLKEIFNKAHSETNIIFLVCFHSELLR